MQVTKSTIFQLFQMEQRHLVPLFQRAYVWGEEGQWTPLWENIQDKANEVADYEARLSQKSPSLHFLGAIVRSPFRTTGRQVSANLLIDGQQRLTTLQILLFALRDYLNAQSIYADAGHDDVLEMLTKNRTARDPAQTKENYKVWPTNADRPTFKKITEAGTPDALKNALPIHRIKYTSRCTSRPRLAEAYLFFYEQISAYVEGRDAEGTTSDDSETAVKRLDALVIALQNHMELVVIDLEGDEDPQVIFETLNARGVTLLPSDLVRNFVFWEASRSTTSPDELHKTYWEPYDSDFWKQEEQQGRIRRPRIDLFLFRYLVYQTRNEVSITDLFNEFRQWWQKETRNVEVELQKLQKLQHFSGVFGKLIAPIPQSRFEIFAQRVRVLDAGTLYPLLLFLKGESHPSLSPADLDMIAVHLESYLVRRMVCRLTTKNYNNTFLRLLRFLTDEKDAPPLSPDTIADYLGRLTGDTSRWPDDAEFKMAWLTRPAYDDLPQRRVVMVLLALDLQLTTSKQIKTHVEELPSVEHIMPQNGNPTDWPLSLNTDGLAAEEAETAREKAQHERNVLLHTFGNLTLLTQELNSSVSNGPFVKKRPEIAQNATSRLNTYFQTAGDTWDEADIRKRGEALFRTALEIWPKP